MAKRRNTFISWVFAHLVVITVIVFSGQSVAVSTRDFGSLSPVILDGAAPDLAVEPIVRRSDI